MFSLLTSIEQLMNMLGNRSYPFCEYCHAKGIWNGAVYCPFSPPVDAPQEAKDREGSGYPWPQLDRNNLVLRKDAISRTTASHIAGDMCTECPKTSGIRGPAILLQLRSIDFPQSFPTDLMHLAYENIIPALFRHFRGVFFRSNAKTYKVVGGGEIGSHGANEPSGLAETAVDLLDNPPCSEERENPSISSKPPTEVRQGKGAEKLAKFVITDDPWNIHPDHWTSIGSAFEKSACFFPGSFGDPLRNFQRHCHELKAAEWSIVARQAAPIFLKTLLPQEDYEGYLLLVDAIVLLEKHSISAAEIQIVKDLIIRFSQYYEGRFYQQQWNRLRVCLPTMHQLLHVHQFLTALGPAYGYWQWPMERLCGMITQTAKSRSAANQNMANVMVQDEQMNYLPYVLPSNLDHECFTTDNDGQINLADMLINDYRTSPHIPSQPIPDGHEFIAPQRSHTLSSEEQQCFSAYLDEDFTFTNDDECELHLDSFSTTAVRWAGVQFASFHVVSEKMKKSNSTRCNSLIRYEYTDPDHLVKRSAFGRVSFFLELSTKTNYISEPSNAVTSQPVMHHLALITTLHVTPDGRLVKIVAEGGLRMISVEWIKEVMGIFFWEENQYLLSKDTSLLLPR
jgi:hypothetical protein